MEITPAQYNEDYAWWTPEYKAKGALAQYLHSIDAEPYDVEDFRAGMRRAEEQNAYDFAPMNEFIRKYWAEWIK